MQSLLSFMTSCKTHVTKASQMSRSKIIEQHDEDLSKGKKNAVKYLYFILTQKMFSQI